MKLKLFAALVALTITGAVYASANLEFLDGHFSAFLQRLVEPHFRNDFEHYYYNMMQEISKAEPKVQEEMYEYLYKLAIRELKMNQPKWYTAVKPYMSPAKKNDPRLKIIIDKITLFMRRLGAYQEFKRVQLNKHLQTLPNNNQEAAKKKSSGGALDALKMAASNVGRLFDNWFGSLPELEQAN